MIQLACRPHVTYAEALQGKRQAKARDFVVSLAQYDAILQLTSNTDQRILFDALDGKYYYCRTTGTQLGPLNAHAAKKMIAIGYLQPIEMQAKDEKLLRTTAIEKYYRLAKAFAYDPKEGEIFNTSDHQKRLVRT